jgi:hypothetical protein
MASQKTKNSPTESRTSSIELKKKFDGTKRDTQSSDKMKPKFTFKKAKKISKSVKRIESEISKIQIQMARIGKDLTTVLELIDTKKKS